MFYTRNRSFCLILAGLMIVMTISPRSYAAENTGNYFSASDYKDISSEVPNAIITLDGDHGTISDDTLGISGNPVRISRKGVYRITGSAENVTIWVEEAKESGNIYLVLENVCMINRDTCFHIEKADSVILQCTGNNRLTSTEPEKAAVFSRDDLTINGTGSLSIVSGAHGISCNDTLRITGAELFLQAHNTGLKANDGLFIGDGFVSVQKSYEGIEAEEVIIRGGELSIYASDDGINASGKEELTGTVRIQGGTVYIHSAGDGIDSNGSIFIDDGEITVEGPDNSRNSILDTGDGPDAVLSINGGIFLGIGSAEKTTAFNSGSQYNRLEIVSGAAGDIITIGDGTSFTTSKSYSCILYSSPQFSESDSISVQKGSLQ